MDQILAIYYTTTVLVIWKNITTWQRFNLSIRDPDLFTSNKKVCTPNCLLPQDLSLNPAEVYSLICKKMFEKHEKKQKQAGIGPFLILQTKMFKAI